MRSYDFWGTKPKQLQEKQHELELDTTDEFENDKIRLLLRSKLPLTRKSITHPNPKALVNPRLQTDRFGLFELHTGPTRMAQVTLKNATTVHRSILDPSRVLAYNRHSGHIGDWLQTRKLAPPPSTHTLFSRTRFTQQPRATG